jgi:hypothetical protein
MISLNKLVGLIAQVGFCRAVFVGAMCLLVVHVVSFEEFVILALFGFAMDGVSVRKVKAQKQTNAKGRAGLARSVARPMQPADAAHRDIPDLVEVQSRSNRGHS